jgi:hypothetical protein
MVKIINKSNHIKVISVLFKSLKLLNKNGIKNINSKLYIITNIDAKKNVKLKLMLTLVNDGKPHS